MTITRHDPPSVALAPGLISQMAAPTDRDLVFCSGQVAWDTTGRIQGVGDLAAQVAQVSANIDALLTALGASRSDIVKETIYVVDWRPELLPVVIGGLRDGSPVPASTLLGVAALVDPDALVEVEIVVAVDR